MTHYSVHSRDRIFIKGYEFFAFGQKHGQEQ